MSSRSVPRLGVFATILSMSAMLMSPPVAEAVSPQQASSLSRLSGSVIVAKGVHDGTIVPKSGSGAASSSAAPSLSALPNVQASAGTQPVNEDPIAADPNNPMHLLTAGNDYNCPSLQGFFSSNDGGATWGGHCLGTVGGLQGFGDPVVGYDLSGNSYAAGIDATAAATNGRIVFEKSATNGATWSPTAVAVPPLFANGLPDKPWMEIDHGATSPHPGAIYISTTQFNAAQTGAAIAVSHSYDGGTTWAQVQVGPLQTGNVIDQFTDLAVGPNGTVYLSFMRCSATGPTGDCGGSSAQMLFSRSTDGGVTWSPLVISASGVALAPDTCGAFYGCVPGTGERVSDIPTIDIDPTTGALYVSYYTWTGSIMQVRVTRSVNGGTSWGAPVVVAPTLNNDQFLSWMAVSPSGTIGVSMLVRTGGVKYVSAALVSTNGGVSFTGKKTASAVSKTTNDGFGGTFMGDYSGGIWTGNVFHTCWTDTRTGVAADETGGLS
jgi:hypothetical protein